MVTSRERLIGQMATATQTPTPGENKNPSYSSNTSSRAPNRPEHAIQPASHLVNELN